MSLWTPSGEHPVDTEPGAGPGPCGAPGAAPRRTGGGPGPAPAAARGPADRGGGGRRRAGGDAPAAGRHPGRGRGGQPLLRPVRAGRRVPLEPPPLLAEAKLAIDALGALVGGAGRPAGRRRASLARPWPRSGSPTSRSRGGEPAAEGARRGHRLARRTPGAQAPRLTRPRWPGATTNATSVPTSMRRVPSAIPVAWNPKRPPSSATTVPSPRGLVELRHRAEQRAPQALQWTILDRASSKMSVAPWSFRAGMSVLMSSLAPPSRPRSPPRPRAPRPWATAARAAPR